MLNNAELRLECLRLAAGVQGDVGTLVPTADVVDRARRYADFVLGESDGKTIDAARQFTEKVR